MDIPQGLLPADNPLCDIIRCDAVLVPLFVGVMLSSFLLGVVLILTVAAHWGQPALTQAVLLVVAVLQVAQTGLDIARTTSKYALHFGSLLHWIEVGWADALAPFLGALFQMQTQFFLLARAHRYAPLARPVPAEPWIAALVGLLILLSGACGLAVGVETKVLGRFDKLVPGSTASSTYTVLVQVWLVSSATIDSILSGTIAYELIRARKWSSAQSTNAAWARAIARRLTAVLIQSGLLLTFVQIFTVALWRMEMHPDVETRGSAYVLLPLGVLPKLYTLTFLVILLSTPPPAALAHEAAATTATAGTATHSLPRTLQLTPGSPSVISFGEKSKTIPAQSPGDGLGPRLAHPVLMVRPDWISLATTTDACQTRPEQSIARESPASTAHSEVTTVSPEHTHVKIGTESGIPCGPFAPVKVRDFGRAPHAGPPTALELNERSPGQGPDWRVSPGSGASTLFPLIEHPYAAPVNQPCSLSPPAPPTSAPRRAGGSAWSERDTDADSSDWDARTRVGGADTPTGPSFDVEELLKYKLGTLHSKHTPRVLARTGLVIQPRPLVDGSAGQRDGEGEREGEMRTPMTREFSEHARAFMQLAANSTANSAEAGDEAGRGEGGGGVVHTRANSLAAPVMAPRLTRLQSGATDGTDASWGCVDAL